MRAAVVSLLCLALILRLAAVLFFSGFPPCCDANDYIRHGESIAAGHGYPESFLAVDGGPTALRPPLYPYFLGAIFAVRHSSLRAARLAQAVLATVGVGLLALLAWQVFRDRRIAVVTLGLAAVFPPMVLWPTTLLSEPIFLPLEIGALAAAWQFRRDRGRLRFPLLAGLLAGLAALTRQPGFLIVVPAAAATLTAVSVPRLRRWTATIMMVLVLAAVVAPWTVRNAVVMHAFIPVALQTGLQLAGTYNDQARTDPQFPAMWRIVNYVPRDAPLFSQHGITEVDQDRVLTRNGLEYIRSHPDYVPVVVALNSLHLLHIDKNADEQLGFLTLNLSPRLGQLHRFGFYAAAILAAAGTFTLAVRRVPLWFWLTPLGFFLAGVIVVGTVRYRAPVDPFFLLAGAPALVALWDRLRRRSASPG